MGKKKNQARSDAMLKRLQKKLEKNQKELEDMERMLTFTKEQLDREALRNKALFNSIGEGIIVTDSAKRIVRMNAHAEDMFGIKLVDVLDKDISEVLPIENKNGAPIPIAERPLEKAFSKGGRVRTLTISNYYFKKSDGTRFPGSVTATVYRFEGVVVGAVLVFQDVTQEKEIDRQKSEFVSLASHQLSNPLVTANWFIETLFEERVGTLNEKQRKYLEAIYFDNKKMIELVNDLLNVSKIELGVAALGVKKIDVKKLADQVVKGVAPQINQKGIEFLYSCEIKAPLSSNEKVLEVTLYNLLSNAVKYTPNNGKVALTIKQKNHNVHIEVVDGGIGIPKNEQGKIFNRFFRASNAAKSERGGSGLGLYIVKSMVEKVGGTITFKSPAKKEGFSRRNSGTLFHVTIPIRKK